MKTSRFFSPINVALAAGVLASLGTAGRARAATFHVATAQELQTTLFTAQANGEDDTIYFAAGIYSGQFTFTSTEAQSLTLLPETNAPVGQVVVSGGMSLSAGYAPRITVRGITFKNASTGLSVGSPASLVGCVFQACGTGFLVVGGNAFISGCLMTSNSGRGGHFVECESVTLDHNTIQGNAGGGITIDGGGNGNSMKGPITVVDNRFVGNGGGDGPLYANTDGTSVVSNNVFLGNKNGGAWVYGNDRSQPHVASIVNNQFIQNSGTYSLLGGARSTVCQGNTFRGNSLPLGNTQTISLHGTYVSYVNNLVVSNSAGVSTYVSGTGTNWVANNTIYGNTGNGLQSVLASWNYVHNNIIWGNSGSDIVVGTGANRFLYSNNYHSIASLVDLAVNNIDVDPLFVDAPGGDYHLRANSRCLNAGLNTSTNGSPALPPIDKDGNVRIADGTVDLGAYEQATTDQHPADTDTNWVMTVAEFTAYATAWTNRAAWATGPNPIPIDYVTRAGYLAGTNSGAYHNAGGGKPRNWQP